MSKFTDRLQLLKKSSGKTQLEIAKEIGITPQAMSYYMNGREPNFEVLIKIAKYFNVTTDYLVGMTDQPSPIPSNLDGLENITSKAIISLKEHPLFVLFINYLADIGYSEKFMDKIADIMVIASKPQDTVYILNATEVGAKCTEEIYESAYIEELNCITGGNSWAPYKDRDQFYSANLVYNENILLHFIHEIENAVNGEFKFSDYLHQYYDPFLEIYHQKYHQSVYAFSEEACLEHQTYESTHPEEMARVIAKEEEIQAIKDANIGKSKREINELIMAHKLNIDVSVLTKNGST